MEEILKKGEVLNNRYEVLRVLGQGGMSNVYLVKDKKLKSQWALKEMLDVFPLRDKTKLLEQFKKEAQILAGIKHPNLPRVFDYFEENGRHYLVMEFIEGKTVQEIAEEILPCIDDILNWSIQLCDLLGSLHKEGIIYRDLKPANIMVNDRNIVFLIDFGIARLFTGGKIHDTIIIGTPGYASPEHHCRSETDVRSDIFSLGATMHFLLTGVDPGDAPFVFKVPHVIKSNITLEVSNIVMKAVSLNPDNRFQSAMEMKEAIELILDKKKSKKPKKDSKSFKVAIGKNITKAKIDKPVFYGEETFTFDPLKSYLYPALFSGGFVSAATGAIILISGGAVSLPIIGLCALGVAPGAYLARQLSRYINKSPKDIKIKVNKLGLEIAQGRRFARVSWEDIIGLLVFTEKSRLGMNLSKFKLSTKKGNFEYDSQTLKYQRFNDIVITHSPLTLAGESAGYKRYVRLIEEDIEKRIF